MAYISNDVLSLTCSNFDSKDTLRLNLPQFFPAAQTTCRKLAKWINESDDPEVLRDELVTWLTDYASICTKGRDTKVAGRLNKNIEILGGKDMKKGTTTAAQVKADYENERKKVAAYAEKVRELTATNESLTKELEKHSTNWQEEATRQAALVADYKDKFDRWSKRAVSLAQEVNELRSELDALKATKPIVTLQDNPDAANDTPAPNTNDSNKAPETLQELTQIDGVTLQVNGKKTSSPVSWIFAPDAYKDIITKLGFKWSDKKQGYWKKGIAA